MQRPAALDRLSPLWRRSPGVMPGYSRWTLTVDATLAAALTLAVVDGALNPFVPTAPAPTVLGAQPPALTRDGLLLPMTLHGGPVHPLQLVLASLIALPLVGRRRYPLSVFWVVIVATVLYHFSPGYDATYTFVCVVVAAYSAMMYCPYQWLATASALVGAALMMSNHRATLPILRPGLTVFLVLIPIGVVAKTVHTWRQRIRTLEQEQAAATSLAVERERARIAHELHDVVTHNVSVMVVQAGAARLTLKDEPEQTESALLAVEAGGRAALAELRTVMGLLTTSDEAPDAPARRSADWTGERERSAGSADTVFGGELDDGELAPQPGLDQVEALVDRVRGAGVQIKFTVDGTPVPLTASKDLAAYRVVQEALTNALKHAPGAGVRIFLDYRSDSLSIEVTDSGGKASALPSHGSGRGLLGLRERLALCGGALEAGPRSTRGYRVYARIPLRP